MSIEDEIKEIEIALTSKLNQLINLYKEKKSLEEFIREQKLTYEYDKWRPKFYNDRKWLIERKE